MSYLFILGEVAPYILVVVVLLALAISRWKRRRDSRKAARKGAKEAMEEKMLELELAAQMGELEEKLAIEVPEETEVSDPKWWDQSDLV